VLSNAKVCVITIVCNLRRIVQINFLVKSEESTFIVVALPSKTRDNIITDLLREFIGSASVSTVITQQ
jgi:hypothetical protein